MTKYPQIFCVFVFFLTIQSFIDKMIGNDLQKCKSLAAALDKSKKHKNTVLGYKKGSKTKSENGKIFFDPKLYIELFCNFVKYLIVLDVVLILGILVRI